jgi:hypothetical protein
MQNILMVKTTIKSITYTNNINIPIDTYKIIIMDFENALYGKNYSFLFNDLGRLCADIEYNMRLNLDNIINIVQYLNICKSNINKFSIYIILNMIDELKWRDKIDFESTINFKYNPFL